jgi:hypothetical protein
MRKRVAELKNKYQHIIMPAALVGGFILDIFTLNRIDQAFDNIILISHLILSGTSILLLFSRGTRFGNRFLNEKRVVFLQTLMVFSFGALFSGFIIFYTRSGSLLTSWPFVLGMLVLMLGTEFKKKYFFKLQLQISVYYLAIISWATFFVPVVLKEMGTFVFILSTLIGIGIMFAYLGLLRIINNEKFKSQKKILITRVVIIAALFNLLYFTNIIPPIPLSLKHQAVYYDVTKLNPGYKAQYEENLWYNFFQKRSRTIYWRAGEDIFVFTQVFAPTDLKTTITHVWEYYDESNRIWREKDSISLPITGGRGQGYRGFSRKTSLEYGRWRVKTKIPDGKTLGIIRFDITPYGPPLRKVVTEEL